MSKRTYKARQAYREISRNMGYVIHMLYLSNRQFEPQMNEARDIRNELIKEKHFDKAEYAYGWALARADHHNPLPP